MAGRRDRGLTFVRIHEPRRLQESLLVFVGDAKGAVFVGADELPRPYRSAEACASAASRWVR